MTEVTMSQETIKTGKRPGFLTVLCILTFIGSGFGTLFKLLATIGMGAVMESIPGLGDVMAIGTGYLMAGTLLTGGFLLGAIQMWRLKKVGFFIYAGAMVISIVLPLIFDVPFSVLGVLSSILFTLLYSLNLKHMH